MFVTKEQLLNYLLEGNLHLSKKDYGFFSNLKYIIQESKQITSNQAKLFNKLVVKYKRQFTKYDHKTEELISLDWKIEIVESKQEYLTPKLFITDNKLCFKLPFNNLFIKYFKKIDNNTFNWNKVHKRYESDFNSYSLKIALLSLKKFYSEIVFDENIQSLLNEIDAYKNMRFWEPTLIKKNDAYYVVAINDSLFSNIKHLTLSDDPLVLFELSRYGVKVDASVIQEDNFKKFASEFYQTIDLEDMSKIFTYLKLLNINSVTLASEMIYSKEISKEVKQKLLDAGIECYPPYIKSTDDSVLIQYSRNSHTIKKTKNILKCINLTNSRPINVK